MYSSLSGMHCRAVTYLIALTTILPLSVDSLIVQGPSNTTAMVNESTYFNCSTSIRPVHNRSIVWFHFPLDGGGQRNYVYDDGRIMTDYRNRFAIDKDLSSGKFNLLVLMLESKDAGRYECRDDILEDIGASAELTVLDSDLVCESDMDHVGVVGPTQCDKTMASDELQLSCRVTYKGRTAPQMVWRKAGDSSTQNKTNCVTKVNSVTCNTTLTANLQLNRAVYICESTTQHYNCSLKINNILYALPDTRKWEYNTGNKVSCVANVSRQLPCSYQWYKENSTAVSSDETLKPTDPGLYRCQAQCTIRNHSCTFTAMAINVSTVSDPGQNLLHCLWLLLLIPAIIGVILAIRNRCSWLRAESHPLTQRTEEMPATSSESSFFLVKSTQFEDASSMAATATDGEKTNDETNEKGPNVETNVDENSEKSNVEKKQKEIIERYREFLVQHMDPDFGLLETLLAKGTLSWKEISEVKEKNPLHKRNSQLLNYILVKNQYSGLIEALEGNEQLHIVNYLKANGVLPKLHTQLYGSLENVTPAEDEIVSSITSVLNSTCTSTAESNRLLNLVQLRLIAAKKGQSIVLYIWCETVDQLLRLQELLISGHLKKFVEQLFNQLLTRSPRVAVNTITMNDEEFRRLEAYFTGLRPLEGRHDFASAIKQANKEKRLTGVTVLKNTLFVATQNPSALQIYDVSKTFQLIRKVPVPDLVNPFDIACCYPTECVFISDSKLESNQKEIIRIESSLTVGKRWSTGDDFGNLSVSNESNVVLCVSDKNMLIEYTRDGETVRIINLPDLVHPRHAIKLTNAEFVISHGCQNDALHRVCSVNKDGEVMKSFGGEKGTYIKHLNEPDYLIVDEAGSIFVADRSNKRVVVLDSNLKFKRDFLTRKYPELISPGKMCRCKDTHNLYMVGLDAEYRVLIFIIE